MTDMALINLRATVAMRQVDLEIASKHYNEAAARVMSPANAAACERARVWMENRREARDDARGRLIRHNQREASAEEREATTTAGRPVCLQRIEAQIALREELTPTAAACDAYEAKTDGLREALEILAGTIGYAAR